MSFNFANFLIFCRAEGALQDGIKINFFKKFLGGQKINFLLKILTFLVKKVILTHILTPKKFFFAPGGFWGRGTRFWGQFCIKISGVPLFNADPLGRVPFVFLPKVVSLGKPLF